MWLLMCSKWLLTFQGSGGYLMDIYWQNFQEMAGVARNKCIKNINCWINIDKSIHEYWREDRKWWGEQDQELHKLGSNSHLLFENQGSMWMSQMIILNIKCGATPHLDFILKFKNGTGAIDWSIYLELLSCSLGGKTQLLISRAMKWWSSMDGKRSLRTFRTDFWHSLVENSCFNLLHQTCFTPDQLPSHLQVSVHNAHVMQVFHSVQDLLYELTGIFLSVKSFFHNPVEEFATGHPANGKTERRLQSCLWFLYLSHTHQRTCSLSLVFLPKTDWRTAGSQQKHMVMLYRIITTRWSCFIHFWLKTRQSWLSKLQRVKDDSSKFWSIK